MPAMSKPQLLATMTQGATGASNVPDKAQFTTPRNDLDQLFESNGESQP